MTTSRPGGTSRAPSRSNPAPPTLASCGGVRSEEHTFELQSRQYLVCGLLLEKKIHPPAPSHSLCSSYPRRHTLVCLLIHRLVPSSFFFLHFFSYRCPSLSSPLLTFPPVFIF